MSSMLMPTGKCARCVAFKAGPLRITRLASHIRPIYTVTASHANGDAPVSIASSSAPPAGERHPPSPSFLETAVVTLVASGVVAGSCLAADGPESAAQAVQTAKLASDILRPLFNVFTILYIIRVPMTWYPDIDGKKLPWLIAYVPTEPSLSVTRKVIPLVSGVDVSPIVWVGLISFLSEILLGPQGLLTLIQARGGM